MKCFENLVRSFPMQVYIEVSKNHSIPIAEVIKGKFKPEIRILIMYYSYQFQMEQKEYERIEKEMEKQKREMEVSK